MKEREKLEFCRMLAIFRAMYPNEFNMSELTPTAYWLACRESSLGAVTDAFSRLMRAPEWLRQMPPAPVLAAEARQIDLLKNNVIFNGSEPIAPTKVLTPKQKRWATETAKLVERYVNDGMERGAANSRTISQMLQRYVNL